MTTAELLAEIERLEKAATPGPWMSRKSVHGNKYRYVQIGPDENYTTLELELNDAKLIASLRNNLPTILSALRGVEAAREKRIADEKAATNLLQEEWGPSYDTKVAQAARAARYFGGQQLIDFLNTTGLGNAPELVRTFAKVGEMMAKDAALSEVTP